MVLPNYIIYFCEFIFCMPVKMAARIWREYFVINNNLWYSRSLLKITLLYLYDSELNNWIRAVILTYPKFGRLYLNIYLVVPPWWQKNCWWIMSTASLACLIFYDKSGDLIVTYSDVTSCTSSLLITRCPWSIIGCNMMYQNVDVVHRIPMVMNWTTKYNLILDKIKFVDTYKG